MKNNVYLHLWYQNELLTSFKKYDFCVNKRFIIVINSHRLGVIVLCTMYPLISNITFGV